MTSFDDVLDKHIGPVGSPERTEFDKEVDGALGTPAETWMRLHYFYLQDLKALAKAAA